MKHISTEIKKIHQLWITLNNPEKLNAISPEMIRSLTETLFVAESNPHIKVIIITGKESAFSSGGDVQSMHEKSGMFAGDSNELRMKYMQGIQKIPKCMEDLSKPIIAMVNGAAIGAGCDLAMMCDLRIGSEKSKFGETFAKIGLISGDGGSFFLTRVVGFAKALQMTLTADIFEGQKAFDFGLMNYLVPHDQLMLETEMLADKISQLPAASIQMAKKLMKVAYFDSLQANLDLAAAFQGISQRTPDHEKAVAAFVNKK